MDEDKKGEKRLEILMATKMSVDEVKKLLDEGVPPNACDPDGCTVLMAAATGGNVGIIKLLIDSGAKPLTKHKENGNTALHYAASKTKKEAVEYLIKLGGKDGKNKDGKAPIDMTKGDFKTWMQGI